MQYMLYFRKPQWTSDEAVFARNVTNEVHFYKADDLQTIAEKKVLQKVRSFSISPSTKTHHVTFFVPSKYIIPIPSNAKLRNWKDLLVLR